MIAKASYSTVEGSDTTSPLMLPSNNNNILCVIGLFGQKLYGSALLMSTSLRWWPLLTSHTFVEVFLD